MATAVVPVTSPPGGRRPRRLCTTVFGTFMYAPAGVVPLGAAPVFAPGAAVPISWNRGCDRTVPLTRMPTFGTVYDADPRSVVSTGSTERQFRGSGLSIFTTVAQVSVIARPVVVPTWAVSPCRVRAFTVTSTPCQ